jgi:hypothetical protein
MALIQLTGPETVPIDVPFPIREYEDTKKIDFGLERKGTREINVGASVGIFIYQSEYWCYQNFSDRSLQNIPPFSNSPSTALLFPVSDACDEPSIAPRESIESLFITKDRKAVSEFLSSNQGLRGLLVESSKRIRNLFGQNSQIELRIIFESDNKDEDRIFGYIYTDLQVDEAIKKLDELDDSWLLGAIQQADGKLNFNLRFL